MNKEAKVLTSNLSHKFDAVVDEITNKFETMKLYFNDMKIKIGENHDNIGNNLDKIEDLKVIVDK